MTRTRYIYVGRAARRRYMLAATWHVLAVCLLVSLLGVFAALALIPRVNW
jgi:hypothetical protein